MSTLRITAGTLRGRRITVPPGEVRPTSERARQAYFNIIGDRILDAHFIDLFAGSGIFSFEAVSRGAVSAIAVDSDRRAIAGVEKQAAKLDVAVTAVTSDVMKWLMRAAKQQIRAGLVYADPPYDYRDYPALVQAIGALALEPEALVAVEHRRATDPFGKPGGDAGRAGPLRFWRRAEYGEVWLTFFSAEPATGFAITPEDA